jgi:hypothetical protein
MRYWWVNQNQTYKHEVQGGFLWSPKTKKNGAKNHFYDTMTQVSAGDLVLSFCNTQIKAVGVAQGPAESTSKPAFGAVGDQWDDEGWLVPVEFEVADQTTWTSWHRICRQSMPRSNQTATATRAYTLLRCRSLLPKCS